MSDSAQAPAGEAQSGQGTQAQGGEVGTSGVVEQSPAWVAQLPEDLRTDDFKQYEKLGDLAKDHLETKKELNELKQKSAAPESADGYDVKMDDLPEGVKLNEGELKTFKEVGHQMGLTNNQLNSLLKWEANRQVERMEANQRRAEEDRKKVEAVLKETYGTKTGEQIEKIRRIAKNYGGEEFEKELTESALGNNIGLMKTLAGLADRVSEGTFAFGQTASGQEEGVDLNKVYGKSMNHLPQGRR